MSTLPTKKYFFKNLFILDMANNHMGDVEHGIRIINELREVTDEFKFPCAIKFQYRDLDTFIHPRYKSNLEFKYVKRFQETRFRKVLGKTLSRNLTGQVPGQVFWNTFRKRLSEHFLDFRLVNVAGEIWICCRDNFSGTLSGTLFRKSCPGDSSLKLGCHPTGPPFSEHWSAGGHTQNQFLMTFPARPGTFLLTIF